ncbi:MAG: 3' terminal RNA ribose 2'-O-methyltransferase Hen1 [Saprospiraceae bacterium]|nr:3' terminal RNA ribose 2'-O-methyltransferase Hen1 [Saprospiraceae bacterium]
MLLSISTTYQPATDLGYLLGKHPGRFQSKELPFGNAHVFFPEASDKVCTASLLLELNPVELLKSGSNNFDGGFQLEHFVNDRPYVASSFLTTAISKVFGSALNGNCKERPELAETPIPLVAELPCLPVRGGEAVLRRFFEPLGYEVEATQHPLDEQFPNWGSSAYFSVRLRQNIQLQHLLSHLFVLIPALDHNKHYYMGKEEIEKLLEKGGDWLKQHPEQEFITRRYLKNRGALAKEALSRLVVEDEQAEEEETVDMKERVEKTKLHDIRLRAVVEQLKASGARSVLDLGCGEGKLIRLLMPHGQFDKIRGMDISLRTLQIAQRRLNLSDASPAMKERIALFQGSLTYRDARLDGFDAAALVEVIEHLDEARLDALQKVLFGHARPSTVVITTPNGEYNVLFEGMPEGKFRHSDHRFEWTRSQFRAWCDKVCEAHGYQAEVLPLGDEDETHGAPSQMAVFQRV